MVVDRFHAALRTLRLGSWRSEGRGAATRRTLESELDAGWHVPERRSAAGSDPAEYAPWRGAHDDDLPRFLTSFEMLSGDQITGMTSPALMHVTGDAPRVSRQAVRALVADLAHLAREKSLLADITVTIAAALTLAVMVKLASMDAGSQRGRHARDDARPQAALDHAVANDAAATPRMGFAARIDAFPEIYALAFLRPSSALPPRPPDSGAAPSGYVVLRDLPAGTALSRGGPLAPNAWAVPLADVETLSIALPAFALAPEGGAVRVGMETFDHTGTRQTTTRVELTTQPIEPFATANLPVGMSEALLSDIATGAVDIPEKPVPPMTVAPTLVEKPVAQTRGGERRARPGRWPSPQHVRRASRQPKKVTPQQAVQSQPTAQQPFISLFTPAGDGTPAAKASPLTPAAMFPMSPLESEAARW